MMKKLSRIALLAAASVFMLAVFPACGDDDGGNDDPKATLTLVGDAVELEIGAEKTVEATVTVENDTFSDNAQKIQQGEPIPKAYFELKATDATKVTVSEATVKAWDGKTKATITFTVTAAEGAAAGKISAEIKADTLTSNATRSRRRGTSPIQLMARAMDKKITPPIYSRWISQNFLSQLQIALWIVKRIIRMVNINSPQAEQTLVLTRNISRLYRERQ